MADYTKEARFKVTTVAWKNHSLDDSYEIEYSGGWMVSHWNDDETSSKGLCLLTNYTTAKGNVVSVETVISKDNLIKALALLVDEEEDES